MSRKNSENGLEKKKSGSFAAMFRTKAMRAGGYSIAAAAVVIVIAVLLNVLAGHISTAYTQFDTTASGVYSVSQQTKSTVKGLSEDVYIYYVVSDGKEVTYVTRLLDKFSSYSKKLHVEKVDPDTDPNFTKQYTEDSVSDGDILVVCGDKCKVVPFDEMITYEAGSAQYYYYYLQQGQQTAVYWNGEVALIKAVDYVVSTEEYTVVTIGSMLGTIEKALETVNITAEDYDSAGDPASADCVVIAGMTSDITDEQYDALSAYISGGGKILVAADYTEDGYPNIEKLLDAFGVSFTDGLINDMQRGSYYPYGTTEDLLPKYTGEHAVIYPLLEGSNVIYLPGCMGIEISEKADVLTTPLLTTSTSAYVNDKETSTADADKEKDYSAFTLAAASENSANGSSLVVIGDEDFLDDSNTEMAPANTDLMINGIAWLCDKDSAISVHAKTLTSSTQLEFEGAGKAVAILLIIAVPFAASVCAGSAIWLRRKNK